MRRRLLSVVVCLLVAAPLALAGASASAAPRTAKPYDVNGDGYPELVVGAFGLRVGSARRAGGVVVLPASKKGLSLKEQVITQSSPGVAGKPETGDYFGYAVASADFDADGYADLAIGANGEKLGDDQAGTVTVVYGTRQGLDTRRSTTIERPGTRELGTPLAAGDFTGDGYPDLAMGVPLEDDSPDDERAGGVVRVLRGGPQGIGVDGELVLHGRQGTGGADREFGTHLAVGDLDRDGIADLVVGAAQSAGPVYTTGGSVSVCLGAKTGPTGCSLLSEDETFTSLNALAVGNVTGSAVPEVVVGADGSQLGDRGRVVVLQLEDSDPLSVSRRTEITASSAGLPGAPGDEFGFSLAVGDVDHDGFSDLVVGAEGADDGRGRVVVVHGARDGYRTSGNETFDQDTTGVPGKAERRDFFGAAVSLQDHDADGNLDLDVGAPRENYSSGSVTTLRGVSDGFTTSRAKTFGLDTLGYAHPDRAFFGSALGQR